MKIIKRFFGLNNNQGGILLSVIGLALVLLGISALFTEKYYQQRISLQRFNQFYIEAAHQQLNK